MRVADKMNYNQVNTNLSKNRTEMNDLQNQAATQKRINKPSDDPAAAARVLAERTEERGARQYIKNVNVARSFLEFTDQSLSEMTETLMRAKELAIQQANDAGASPDTRRAVAAEVEQMHAQAVQIGNRKLGERYIFGGFKTTSPPFDLAGQYHGDDGGLKLQISKDAFIAMNISGDKVLMGKGLSTDGLVRAKSRVPRDVNQLQEMKLDEQKRLEHNQEMEAGSIPLRGPASEARRDTAYTSVESADTQGIDILGSLRAFEIALRTNDKHELQTAIDNMDASISQVINARASVGARLGSLGASTESLQKSIVETKAAASQLEDADLFEVVSDINRTESTLKATLETSGKVMNLSLLDFLR